MAVHTIEGSHVRDIRTFYDELNRVFMADEDWRLGQSLDALADMLHGGFGALLDDPAPVVVWRDHPASRAALGVQATRGWIASRASRPGYDPARLQADLDELERGGRTYFDIVLEIFGEYPEIELRLE
ncbi:barstar family protein [Cellulomonas sp. HZM]|uniref:barstar family protein n=1 Tax=Cellulomonas sp. HZM TaxID=1454010 RepID=UPI000492F67F|nr:barstar family protein [Cellulomonas sp. HZM]